ncbi:MAG: T9SS type A sorting domain-containing protein [Ignavibacteriae bacterium]|nr:T9SS type A sorting domain-containing protein [Ignavibacteriota bacterium]
MKKTLVLLFAVVLCSLGMQSVSWGQNSFVVPVVVSNGADSDTIYIGVNSTATYGIDAALGEQELPPAPPSGVFDARSSDIPGRTGLGQGVSKDLRALADDCQADTFKIKFQPSDEGGSDITITWPALDSYGCGRWRLTDNLGASPNIDVDMLSQNSVTVNFDDYGFVYIRKVDGAEFRTFGLEAIALDGTVDSKGVKKYGKNHIKPKSTGSDFSVTFTNNETGTVNGLYVDFKEPIDTTEDHTYGPFTVAAEAPKGKSAKWNYSGATISNGGQVTVTGWSKKDGSKGQSIATFYWTNNGTIVGTKKKGAEANFTKNVVRLPMPNALTGLEQALAQKYPLKTDYMYVGVYNTVKGGPPFLSMKKYGDVLKTLVANAGKVGKQILQDSAASCFDKFDKAKGTADRLGKATTGNLKTMGPDKQRNRLAGSAVMLSVNLAMSETEKIPAGLGQLQINKPTSPFHSLTVDSLLAKANQFLSYCPTGGAYTADELADEIDAFNAAFEGDLDTASWSGGKVIYTGVKAVGDLGGVYVRDAGITPKVLPGVANYSETPYTFSLGQNYPNPFNPNTTIQFTLPTDGLVTIKVFNLLGQEVATLVNNEEYTEGIQELNFDATNLSSGIYFYRINVNDINTGEVAFEELKKMVLMK